MAIPAQFEKLPKWHFFFMKIEKFLGHMTSFEVIGKGHSLKLSTIFMSRAPAPSKNLFERMNWITYVKIFA